MGDHITVEYMAEVPGHHTGEHVTEANRDLAQKFMGSQEDQPIAVRTGERLVAIQRQQQAIIGDDDPMMMYFTSTIPTSGPGELNVYDKALYEVAYAQQYNEAAERDGDPKRLVLGDGTAYYLSSLGIDANRLQVTSMTSAQGDPFILDPQLDPAHADMDNIHLIENTEDMYGLVTNLRPVPLVASTGTFTEPSDPGGTQRNTGQVITAIGGGILAAGGLYAAGGYLGTQAMGGSAAAGILGSEFTGATGGGGMNPLEASMTSGMEGAAGETTPLMGGSNNPLSTEGSTGRPGTSTPRRPGLRPRGRPPTTSQIAQLITGGPEVAEAIATASGGAAAGSGAFGSAMAVGLGLGVIGVGLVVGGIAAVSTSDKQKPGDIKGVIADKPDNDPLNNIPIDEPTANFINNMDAMYRNQGFSDDEIRQVHQAEFNGIVQAGQGNDALLQDHIIDLQEQYITENKVQMSVADKGETGGYTAGTGGGDFQSDPNINNNDPTTNIDNIDTQPAPPHEEQGYTADTETDIKPKDNHVVGVEGGDLAPVNPDAVDNNYRGTGYSYYQFMGLPPWLRKKLLGIDEDDY